METFRIAEVTTEYFPDRPSVRSALAACGVPEDVIITSLLAFLAPYPPNPSRGYQTFLAVELADFLRRDLSGKGVRVPNTQQYSLNLRERADVVLSRDSVAPRVYFEIEFRPNVEKDLVKFHVGFNSGLLGAAVLILPTNRKTINPAYKTMPIFSKCVRVIRELRPPYPLLVCGITGSLSRSMSPGTVNVDSTTEMLRSTVSSSGGNAPRRSGRILNEEWQVGARHPLYHKEGTLYNPLKRFPGAYFDDNGYLLFQTESEFLNSLYIKVGDRVNVPGGIAKVPGYVRKGRSQEPRRG